jgi:tRNA pseudouridine38-40 synthase
MRVRVELAYRGEPFHGWQRQPGVVTVQGALEDALSRLTGEPLLTLGASRTDAGVHAFGQVAAFDWDGRLPVDALVRALNHWTPPAITVRRGEEVPDAFHPRHDARSKTYAYAIRDGALRWAWDAETTLWHRAGPLDEAAMHEAAQVLVGAHDFSAFRAAGCQASSPVKQIEHVNVTRAVDGKIRVEVQGTSFLKYMVRTVVGTLLEVGRGRRDAAWVADVLASRDRGRAGMTVEARGLCLEEIRYPDVPWGAPRWV